VNHTDMQAAEHTLQRLKDEFRVDVLADWGDSADGTWRPGEWVQGELEHLYRLVNLLASAMGGGSKFIENLSGVTVQKADIGTHGGEALRHKVSLSKKRKLSAWTVVHELAHAWDANHGWNLSVALEKYTGGWTSYPWGVMRRAWFGADAKLFRAENAPGLRGRLPGCNVAGYFYANLPSGSDWNFNRKEDFAESVAMYLGWGRSNDLSEWAETRIQLHTLANGEQHPRFGVDNWADYKKYFFPENGDYSKTLRWRFVDGLLKGNLSNAG
jgi:hypothetical protein